ncbi:uncharacterized protein LOC127526555 [Erpetoichthys calabaricus]|uniref:uncharacterized protein LOC127526555 n=1 Tax=Erpetoichthys calabaricus TaxID=27687 RepID=UPI0022344ABD|nr:uncharacterized protein LOC127526555 [Erpetoichthys calabaricus]
MSTIFDLFSHGFPLLGSQSRPLPEVTVVPDLFLGGSLVLNILLLISGVCMAFRLYSLGGSRQQLANRISTVTDQMWKLICQLRVNESDVGYLKAQLRETKDDLKKLNKELRRREADICEIKSANCQLREEIHGVKEQRQDCVTSTIYSEMKSLKHEQRCLEMDTFREDILRMLKEILEALRRNEDKWEGAQKDETEEGEFDLSEEEDDDDEERVKQSPSAVLSQLKADAEYKVVFEKYILGRLLGGGGFGQVWVAERIEDHSQVAIKVMDAEPEKVILKKSNNEMEILPWEVGLMKQASDPTHPGVIKLLDWFTGPTKNVLVMELMEASMDLIDYMKNQGGHLTEDVTRNIICQVVHAVQHIHSCRVFHRDLKPENILIQTTTLNIKLIDFGCGTMLKMGKYDNFEGMQGIICTSDQMRQT